MQTWCTAFVFPVETPKLCLGTPDVTQTVLLALELIHQLPLNASEWLYHAPTNPPRQVPCAYSGGSNHCIAGICPMSHSTSQSTVLGLGKQVLWWHGTPEGTESGNETRFWNSLIDVIVLCITCFVYSFIIIIMIFPSFSVLLNNLCLNPWVLSFFFSSSLPCPTVGDWGGVCVILGCQLA